ncbi:hypothetical protein RAA17_07195 [Komagataeibacter rhaeticus]|nr:hypothetical protein [Komagataeibacter rhaeticus]
MTEDAHTALRMQRRGGRPPICAFRWPAGWRRSAWSRISGSVCAGPVA